jgi:3-hydroxy-9,10-secoandrosta-1,3,5(10)-triene-9,17-dione monooxygenase reductase component
MAAAHALQPAEPVLDERSLRAAFGRFATGVALVTAEDDGTPVALIVSSFAAVSLQPPLVSFCVGRGSMTWQRMRRAGRCTINVLAARHAGFVRRAAPRGADRFAEPDVLRNALAAIECELESEHAAGDHWIVVGRVRRLRVSAEAQPLIHFAGRFGEFQPHSRDRP